MRKFGEFVNSLGGKYITAEDVGMSARDMVHIKKETDFGFIKLEYSETDYDEISATTTNSTKITADIDTDILALSVAKSF